MYNFLYTEWDELRFFVTKKKVHEFGIDECWRWNIPTRHEVWLTVNADGSGGHEKRRLIYIME